MAAALLFTWPLARHPFSLLGSTQGPGDTYLNLWVLGWDLQALLHHPMAIVSGRVFDANIFFPASATLTYSDHLLLQAAAVSPLYVITGSVPFCYNALLIGSLALCGLAMHACVGEISDRSPAAWVAGVAWGFAPYHFAHLIHIQLQALYFLPLAFLFLHRVAVHGGWRDVLFLGLAIAGQALSSVYYGVIGGLGLSMTAAIYVIDAGVRPRWPLVRRLVAATAVGALLVAPVAFKYWLVQQREGFGRSLREAAQGSATAGSYLEVPQTNAVYGRLGILKSHDAGDQQRRPTEQNLFPGFVLAGLSIVGLTALGRRDRRAPATAFAVVAIAGFGLSLGPDGLRWLYGALYDTIFGFHALRAPARFATLLLFGLAGLAALGVEALIGKRSQFASAAVAVCVALLAIEYANVRVPYVLAPRTQTPAGEWLRINQEPGAVAYLPLSLDPAWNTTVMVKSLAHLRPIVNGYSGQRPGFFPALVDAAADFPSAESVKTLLDVPVKFVVAPGPVEVGDLPVVERVRFPGEVIYEIHSTPDLDSKWALPNTPPLPPPASIPFVVGEKSTYAVTWTSGPMSVPAGRVVFEIRPGQNGARFEFAAAGLTADWVSAFFRADDRFVSQVDDQLRPLVFEQHLKEGRRQVDRRAVFDRAARSVRVRQGGGPELSLPIPADALDPLALLFYARTLPLTPGSMVLIPMHDSSRNFTAQVQAIGEETILHNNVRVDTVRVTPQIRRAGGVSPLRMTIWFERAGARRLLRADIAGLVGVGAVRVELESPP